MWLNGKWKISLPTEGSHASAAPSGAVSGASIPSVSASNGGDRRPLRLLRHSLDRFARVIEIELENAARHEEKLSRLLLGVGPASELRRELAGASACLQRLRDHLRQLEKLRGVVAESDLARFEEAVTPHETLARERLIRFTELYDRSRGARLARSRETSPPPHLRTAQMTDGEETVPVSAEGDPLLQQQEQLVGEEEDDSEEMLAAWEQLADDLEGLEQMMGEFGRAVHEQGARVDSISTNVDTSRTRVLASVRNLAAASKLKYAVAPIAGAAVGSLVAGPVGFFVGAKMGAAAGLLGGGVVGLAGGGLAGKIHRRRTDVEMERLERQVEEEDAEHSSSSGPSKEEVQNSNVEA